MNDHDTGFHDHDLSAGALSVVRGARPRGAPRARRRARQPRTLSAGQSLTFAASDIHRVSHAGSEPAVTLHAYSPPLWRMGAYEVSPDGTLRRHSMSYAEELRPLDEGARRSRPRAVKRETPGLWPGASLRGGVEFPGLKPRPVTKGICEDWAVPVDSLPSSAAVRAT